MATTGDLNLAVDTCSSCLVRLDVSPGSGLHDAAALLAISIRSAPPLVFAESGREAMGVVPASTARLEGLELAELVDCDYR